MFILLADVFNIYIYKLLYFKYIKTPIIIYIFYIFLYMLNTGFYAYEGGLISFAST